MNTILTQLQYDVLGKHLTRHYNKCFHANKEIAMTGVKSSCETLTDKENTIYQGLKKIKEYMYSEQEKLGLYGYVSILSFDTKIEDIKVELTKKFNDLSIGG